eukprot:gnl/TRDRNA2_/TRDRNA2_171751_c2_seq1.p1 gnl/TRDRNA2_/TRDRNA2_171751_c2~~gnl/TRDRNA2_/TRDRNA2_171751_c2_seq1.p1  ORF type:complete len:391 (+),score=59.11 gnl/TRDRNA2_/TRDRNA2_171751_c2_seq1:325-1497(+)
MTNSDETDDDGRTCPGCFAVLQTSSACLDHMRCCCPHLLPDMQERLSRPEFQDHHGRFGELARGVISQLQDERERRFLELRFGLDRPGGEPRTPAEVGAELGVRPQQALGTINRLLRRLPLVADDHSGLDVLHDDEAIIAVNKPPRLRCSPWHRFAGGSLMNMVAGRLLPEGKRPFSVHSIDSGTSGVVIVAKSKEARAALAASWHSKASAKEYLAIVRQPSDEGLRLAAGAVVDVNAAVVQAAHYHSTVVEERAAAEDDVDGDDCGKQAHTRFSVEAASASAALLRCELIKSGRTHQIRVHAAHAGFPLLADDRYGGAASAAIQRPALHARCLRIAHPTTGERISLEAELPTDFRSCLSAEGLTDPFVPVAVAENLATEKCPPSPPQRA